MDQTATSELWEIESRTFKSSSTTLMFMSTGDVGLLAQEALRRIAWGKRFLQLQVIFFSRKISPCILLPHHYRYLTKFYQFLLVFETEVCQHFVSPRLFRALAINDNNGSGLIPIVFGGVNYSKMFKMPVISRSHKPSSIKSRVGHIFVPSFSVIIQLCSTRSALFSNGWN